MPAERTNVSFEPRPLDLLYSKYGPSKTGAASSTSTTPFTHPSPSSIIKSKAVAVAAAAAAAAGRKMGRSGEKPSNISRRQELGDLKKLGRELTKMERVQMFLNMTNNVGKGKTKSRSQPTSACLKCLNTSCHRCSQDEKHDAEQTAKLKDLKSKLKLVAARSVPNANCRQSQDNSSPTRQSTQHVVALPHLPLDCKRKVSSSEDFVTLRDARQSLCHMFHPQPSISRRTAAAWNYQFAAGSHPPHARHREFLREQREKRADSSDTSSHLVPPAVAAPACSPVDDICETKTVTTFDADRIDSEQFGYVFEHLSGVSSSEDWDSDSVESDTATYSARAQCPSTTGSVPTPQRNVETRASMTIPLSPTSPHQRARDGEAWPPKYTVVPSWPSVDDPFRFQYFGCGVHHDVMRRLHKPRGRRRNTKHGRGSDAEQQQQQQILPQPQKLKVVVPSYRSTDCSVCNATDCEHMTLKPPSANLTPSVAAKSAKSRDSLSMSVCTVVSRQTMPSRYNEVVPKIKDKVAPNKQAEYFHGKGVSLNKDKRSISYGNGLDH